MKNSFKYLFVFFVLLGQFSFSQEDVEKHPLLTDKFTFTGGLFLPSKKVNVSVNGEVIDTDIDFGKRFDIEQYQRTFDLGFKWRFAKKWKLSADYFRMNNVTVAEIDENDPIEWEDYKFYGDVTLGLNVGVLRSIVHRIISQGNKHELGVGIGFHIMPISMFVSGNATLTHPDGGVDDAAFEKQSLTFTAPLPDLGIYYNWAPTPKWFFNADVDFLYIAIGILQEELNIKLLISLESESITNIIALILKWTTEMK